jgi:hypothetical protein
MEEVRREEALQLKLPKVRLSWPHHHSFRSQLSAYACISFLFTNSSVYSFVIYLKKKMVNFWCQQIY